MLIKYHILSPNSKFAIEYYLPNQSRLFSSPQRVCVTGESELRRVLKVAAEHGYDVLNVYEIVADAYCRLAWPL